MNYFNNIFEKVFVINLNIHEIKRELIKLKFNEANINFEFFEAINGYEEPYLSEFKEYYKKPLRRKGAHKLEVINKVKAIKSPGAYGYLKTWEKILYLSIEKKYKNICVFDDDVLLDKDFNLKFNNFINEIKNKWAVINLGSTQHEWNNVKFLKKKKYYYTPENTDGSFAVGLKSNILPELLNEVQKFNCSFDSGALRYIFAKYHTFCYTLYPAIAIADVYKSSISKGRDLITLSKRLKWNLDNINYKNYLNVLISVILPVYNNESNIADCLDNILHQSYKCIEIIIIDNNSNDKTSDILSLYNNYSYNIKVFRNDKYENINYCRNLGLDKSKGDFVFFYKINMISNEERFKMQIDNILKKGLLICSCDNYNNFKSLKIDKYNFDSFLFNMALFKNYRFCNKSDFNDIKYLDFLKNILNLDKSISSFDDMLKSIGLKKIFYNVDFPLYILNNISNFNNSIKDI